MTFPRDASSIESVEPPAPSCGRFPSEPFLVPALLSVIFWLSGCVVGEDGLPASPFTWARENKVLLTWLGAASIVMFVGSLVTIPWLIARMPADYFAESKPPAGSWRARHPIARLTWHIVKTTLGVIFILAGFAMLVLPGQGIISILIGIGLTDFPGKRKLERWILRKRAVAGAIQWIRERAGRPPLLIPERVPASPPDSARAGDRGNSTG